MDTFNHTRTPRTPGEKVRAARVDQGWTQENLARALHVHTSTVQKLEQDDRKISGEMALRLAQALKVSPRWFRPDLPWEVAGNESPRSG